MSHGIKLFKWIFFGMLSLFQVTFLNEYNAPKQAVAGMMMNNIWQRFREWWLMIWRWSTPSCPSIPDSLFFNSCICLWRKTLCAVVVVLSYIVQKVSGLDTCLFFFLFIVLVYATPCIVFPKRQKVLIASSCWELKRTNEQLWKKTFKGLF